MERVRIWDLPTRLFHWTLVGLIAFSWWSAEEEHLDWHIWSGLAVLSLLIFGSDQVISWLLTLIYG